MCRVGKLSICTPPASEEANLVSVTNCNFSHWSRQTQLNVAGLALIGSARFRRSHFKSRSLVNSYRAGAHCDLVTHDVSALFSVASTAADTAGSLTHTHTHTVLYFTAGIKAVSETTNR